MNIVNANRVSNQKVNKIIMKKYMIDYIIKAN